MKVLIVEDNGDMRETMKKMLYGLAAKIQECRDGSEALEAYINIRPDWVLMDIRMEVVDGLTATRQIKTAHPEARIIILTSYDEPLMREAARQAGADYFVPKESLTDIRAILLQQDAARISRL